VLTLGNSLLVMRQNLQRAANEDNQRKIEDEQRNWAAQGVAKFSELMRHNHDDMETFSYLIISELVNYLDATVGALFLINDNSSNRTFLELMAAYAYNKKRFVQEEIEIGEGLVGRCLQENETIYMTDIPDDYIQITSGLGGIKPTSLLLVPLKINDLTQGVIEIASFKEISKHRIEFVERIGESIASTVSTVKITEQTSLLLEQSRDQSEELAAQEETMRLNIEQLTSQNEALLNQQKEIEAENTYLKRLLEEKKNKEQ